ncbi:MAG: site-specific integrase, partial [Desulfobacteraceae bacterium]
RNKLCSCGEDLDKAKQSKKVKYHIIYRVNGKQRWELADKPYSIESARDCEGKRRSQKAENRILDILPESKMTFNELTEWYLELKSVKKLASFERVKYALANFNKVFGDRIVGTIKPVDLEDYQDKREGEGKAPATIDMEISIAKTMVTKAFDNDMVGGHTVKAFRKIKRKLKKGSNARKRVIDRSEYLKLNNAAASHLKPIIIVAYNTGMRRGELRKLQWSHVDRKNMFLRLPKEITKEGKDKIIPINYHVNVTLDNIPRALNHDFVFTYKGQPISHKDSLKKSFKTACDDAGIPHGTKTPNGITFHDIRRTVKTNMLTAGVDKAHRDMILGHSLEGMDYLIPTEDSLKEAMDRYTKWLDGQLAEVLNDQEIEGKETSV